MNLRNLIVAGGMIASAVVMVTAAQARPMRHHPHHWHHPHHHHPYHR
jgi:hypothetical protein